VTSSTPPPQDEHRRFEPVEEGGGIFGRWLLDKAGLPAFRYELDQYGSEGGIYRDSEDRERRDHWHQIGNQRITALASNDGMVQVYLGDRGGVFLNRFEAWQEESGSRPLTFAIRILLAIAAFIARLRGPKPPAPQTIAQAQAEASPRPPRGYVPPEALTRAQDAAGKPRLKPTRDPQATRYAHAGGYSYLDDGTEAWSTAYRYRPAGADTRRTFGMGYFETEMVYRQLRVTRRVYAPSGDVPALLTDVRIENPGSTPVNLRYYEYWDVNVQQLQLEWLRTGDFAPASDENRRALNRYFTPNVQAEGGTLRFTQRLKPDFKAPLPDQIADVDWYPADIFLVDLKGQPDGFYQHKKTFFGAGGARQPDAVRGRRAGVPDHQPDANDSMPYCLVFRRDLRIEPGESQTLRYAYGAARPEQPLYFLDVYRQGEPFAQMRTDWTAALAYFHTGQDPLLSRETAWHSYNLLSAVVYNAFYDLHLVPQGSAYLFLHGADGAPRDQALFALPMTYLKPDLARDLLRLLMRLRDARTGQITYSFAGHGYHSNGLNFHNKPSDLDLFFLLAVTEYLSATGDLAFLDAAVPFYPPNAPAPDNDYTVLNHIRVAARHLFEEVGIGDNGLLKIGSGDWSDGIVLGTAFQDGLLKGVDYGQSKANGESVPNSQMALYVLPLTAALIKPFDPFLAAYIEARLPSLREAVERQWNPQGWYNRAILRDAGNAPMTVDRLDLEAQPWALISGLATAAGHETTLLLRLLDSLDNPSPVGATLTPGGMIWPAVSQLLTWAYVRINRGDLAWRSLERHSFAEHARRFPEVWFNVWSGPDGINAWDGKTWKSEITPMTDFPVMNANQDAMALFGLLRTCGIEPAPGGDGLTIKPLAPRERFTLDLPLLRLDVTPGRTAGVYRAAADGQITLYIHGPAGQRGLNGRVKGEAIGTGGRNPVPLKLIFKGGDVIPFEVNWG
jgi:hypothetical protein